MSRKRWLVWSGLAFVALVASALPFYFTLIGAFYSRALPQLGDFDSRALPQLGDFDSRALSQLGDFEDMRAYYEKGEKDVGFSVPREKWPDILDALTPAEKDNAPSKWQSIGMLIITKRGGHQIAVNLYSLRELPGAFSVSTNGRRVYYRGGDSAKLEAALRAAYEASLDH